MCLSPPILAIGVTDAHFALSGKVFVCIVVLIVSAIRSGKKLLATFISLWTI